MKKILSLCFAVLAAALAAMAQNQYISCSPAPEEDRLDENSGVLVLSRHNDLVVSVVNAPSARITPKGRRPDGLYEYEVIIDPSETTEPKVEVNRRGDINRADCVMRLKKNLISGLMVTEVEKPIRMENHTRANDAILDAELAEVEFNTPLTDLQVDVPAGLGATVTRKKGADATINITSVVFPVVKLAQAREALQSAMAARSALETKLTDGSHQGSDAEWLELDKLQAQEEGAASALAAVSRINIYGTGTNRLSVDISEMGPRSKLVYGVLLLKTIEKEYVSECTGMMAEGGRLFGLRKYAEARQAFANALNAKDTPADLRSTIASNMAQCDSCTLYENYAKMAIRRMKRDESGNPASQADVVRYASGAMEFLNVLNRYNPNDFYNGRIAALQEAIASQPLEIHFTISKWVNDFSGFYEQGRIPNVEIWAYYGSGEPEAKKYRNNESFTKMVKENSDYHHAVTTDAYGEIDLRLNRKELPTGFFFRPVRFGDNVAIKYMPSEELLAGSTGEYNKRRFRLKMYTVDSRRR